MKYYGEPAKEVNPTKKVPEPHNFEDDIDWDDPSMWGGSDDDYEAALRDKEEEVERPLSRLKIYNYVVFENDGISYIQYMVKLLGQIYNRSDVMTRAEEYGLYWIREDKAGNPLSTSEAWVGCSTEIQLWIEQGHEFSMDGIKPNKTVMKVELHGIDEESNESQKGFVYYDENTKEVLVTYPDTIEGKRLYEYLTTPQSFVRSADSTNSLVIGHYNSYEMPSDSEELILEALSSMQGWIDISADWRHPEADDPSIMKSINGGVQFVVP